MRMGILMRSENLLATFCHRFSTKSCEVNVVKESTTEHEWCCARAELLCEWKFGTKLASECECDASLRFAKGRPLFQVNQGIVEAMLSRSVKRVQRGPAEPPERWPSLRIWLQAHNINTDRLRLGLKLPLIVAELAVRRSYQDILLRVCWSCTGKNTLASVQPALKLFCGFPPEAWLRTLAIGSHVAEQEVQPLTPERLIGLAEQRLA